MYLKVINQAEIRVGQLVVLLNNDPSKPPAELRMIEKIDDAHIHLEPLSLMMDDDDVSDILSHSEATQRLKLFHVETGDRIMLRGRPGKVFQCAPNDLHVYIQLDESPNKEIYTNIVHLDFSPSLLRLTVERAQT